MSVGEAEAIDAARRFASARGSGWREEVLSTRREEISGQDCWLITTDQAPGPGEPDWWFEMDGHVTYFVCVATGKCIGLQAGTARHLFG